MSSSTSETEAEKTTTTTTAAMAWSMPESFSWSQLRLENLVYEPRGQHLCRRILQLVERLLYTHTFFVALEGITVHSRQCFKDESNRGAVWIRRRWKDLGNHCYCCLWQLCWFVARRGRRRGSPEGGRVGLEEMQRVVRRYEAVGDKWPWSERSQELKADVIEYALSLSYETGPEVPADMRAERLAFQDLFKEWYELWCEVIHITANDMGVGYPPQRMLPEPRNLAQLMALSAVASSLNESRCKIAFASYAGPRA